MAGPARQHGADGRALLHGDSDPVPVFTLAKRGEIRCASLNSADPASAFPAGSPLVLGVRNRQTCRVPRARQGISSAPPESSDVCLDTNPVRGPS